MKKVAFIVLILASCSTYGQSSQSITVTGNPFYQLPALQTPTLDFEKAFSNKGIATISIYNSVTGLNDSFTAGNYTFSYTRSRLIPTNQFRDVKIDSFNPYGATNFKSALLLGILNSIL